MMRERKSLKKKPQMVICGEWQRQDGAAGYFNL
jgi:hypothetical protein